jgi:hypothetical protein
MKRFLKLSVVGFLLFGFFGCSLSPEEKVSREQALKQTVVTFADFVIQSNWSEVFRISAGDFDSSETIKNHLMKSWVQDATLTGGQIASMSWIDNKTAKVKLNWTFQIGSVQSFSSETFVWVWKGGTWKYKGRALR